MKDYEEKIEVIAYSGYRGEETPKTIFFHGRKIEVIEILRRWIEEKQEDRTRRRFFKLKGSDKAVHLIYYDERSMEWFHVEKVSFVRTTIVAFTISICLLPNSSPSSFTPA